MPSLCARLDALGRIDRAAEKKHLFLEQEDGSRYLPTIDPQLGGKTVFDWRGGKDIVPADCQPPTLFRHGTVRSREQDQEILDRLFLTETVQPRNYRLTSIFWHDGPLDELLRQGDALRIGGNRQVSGAEIVWKLWNRVLKSCGSSFCAFSTCAAIRRTMRLP